MTFVTLRIINFVGHCSSLMSLNLSMWHLLLRNITWRHIVTWLLLVTHLRLLITWLLVIHWWLLKSWLLLIAHRGLLVSTLRHLLIAWLRCIALRRESLGSSHHRLLHLSHWLLVTWHHLRHSLGLHLL